MSGEVTYGLDEHGSPQVTYVVTGAHDIYRLAFAMSNFQCDFQDNARSMFRFLRSALRPGQLDALDNAMGGGRVKKYHLDSMNSMSCEPRIARRTYTCGWGDKHPEKIKPGDRYVLMRIFPGHESGMADDSGKPLDLRLCSTCAARDPRAREVVNLTRAVS